MAKKTRMGKDPLSWIKNTKEKEKKKDSKTAKQKDSKPAIHRVAKEIKDKPKKVTYYISPSLIKKLKYLGVKK